MATSIKERHPLQGRGGYIVKYVPQSKFGVNFSQATKVWCVREREETAVDSAWVTDFGEGFGEATRGSKKANIFYI